MCQPTLPRRAEAGLPCQDRVHEPRRRSRVAPRGGNRRPQRIFSLDDDVDNGGDSPIPENEITARATPSHGSSAAGDDALGTLLDSVAADLGLD
ncbi:hypothetical protein ZWY2020_003322 [Hordeum vulgare]|nr:hypothetical protein ZWY2020_003322 [Hordeum vulgare]